MRFVVEISLGNEAMRTGQDVSVALSRAAKHVLEYCAKDLVEGAEGNIRDANGNTCGRWAVRS
jgi:hypothetical protein